MFFSCNISFIVSYSYTGPRSQFAHVEKLSLYFSSCSFALRVNPFHPEQSLFLDCLLLSVGCFSVLVNYYFQVSFTLKITLFVATITQNTVNELY